MKLSFKQLAQTLCFGAAAAVSFFCAPAMAQQIEPLDAHQDPHGIDLLSNNVATPQRPTLSIPAAPELTFTDIHDFMPVIEVTTGPGSEDDDEVYRVSAGGISSEGFELGGCTFEVCMSVKGTGSRLRLGGDEGAPDSPGGPLGLGGYYFVQGGSGTQMMFEIETEYSSGAQISPVRKYLAETINRPGGPNIHIEYQSANIGGIVRHRPARVVSPSGYVLVLTYQSNSNVTDWGILQRAQIEQVSNPGVAVAWMDYLGNTVTDQDGRVYSCVCQIDIYPSPPGGDGSRMRLPGETENSFETFRQTGTSVRTLTTDGVDYIYTDTRAVGYYSGWQEDPVTEIVITGPEGFYRRIDVENIIPAGTPSGMTVAPRQRIGSVTDSLGNTTTYEYLGETELYRVVYPEGNAVTISRNSYGNVIERRAEAKPGSRLPDIVQSADYNSSACLLGFQCFLPNWTQDGLGNQTDYTWDMFHGGLLTQLDPADNQGRRRLTVNTWSDGQPINGEDCGTFNSSIGTQALQCTPRVTRTEVCEADANGNSVTCGTANSFVQEFTYLEGTSLPLSVTATDGLGNNPLTTTYTYDSAGRVLSEDGPLPGSDDAMYYHYDVLGRRIWEVGPANEEGRRAATRTTYRYSDDQPEMVESGHVAATDIQVDGTGNLVTFALVRRVETDFNDRRLPETVATYEGTLTTPENVAQTSYDALNRAQCSALRMNPAAFGSLPISACDLGTSGAHGEDRISRTVYDTEGRTLEIQQAWGTSLMRTYATYEYSDNGQMTAMTDARNFRAEMVYDGFDRQTRWYFPDPDTTGAVNTGDYEEYTYDANGNRLSLRRRDGMVLNFTYDDLSRMVLKTVPNRAGLPSMFERDVYYEYDIRGLQTRAVFDDLTTGDGLTTSYDTFGRVTANTMTMDGTTRALSYGYDEAGNRTSLTFPDTQTFGYQYTSAGFFNRLTEPSGVWRIDYNYNQRGEVDELVRRGAAPDQDFNYDEFGRLGSSGWSGTGSIYDVTWSFTRNPASQILTEDTTNNLFVWDNHPTGTTQADYITNGLNQYTDVAGNDICHDANGNLTADGDWVYKYDIENRLVRMHERVDMANCPTNLNGYTGDWAAQLEYDPMGRLYEVRGYVNGSLNSTTQFLYDGDALVAEYDTSGNMLRRHIHGPAAGVDDPLMTYTGPGIAITDAVFLYADARGSIVFSSDRGMTTPNVNTYDPYGNQGTTNTGRFQYTGQIWLEEAGLYYYKARVYSPVLGRFMQTDPIGYEDNVNLYAYVGNDPVNFRDPSGLAAEFQQVTGSRVMRGFSSASFASSFLSNTLALPSGGTDCPPCEEIPEGILERGEGAIEEYIDEKMTSFQLGLRGEDYVVERLEEEGYDIIARGLYVVTEGGELRIVDIAAVRGGELTFVEVKVNSSRYRGRQVRIDREISEEGGYVNPTSPAARSFFGPGQTGLDVGLPWVDPTPTRLVQVRCEYLGWVCSVQ